MSQQDTAAPDVTVGEASETATLLDGLAAQAARDALPSDPTPESEAGGPPRDEKGRFTKAEDEGGEAAAEPASDTSPSAEPAAETPEDTPPTLPDGAVQVPVVQGRELATQFTLMDPEGGELAVPDLTIRFTANGKERAEPLDRVVKFAQMGIYNHDREQRFSAIEQQAQQVYAEAEAAKARAAQMEQAVERLLADPNAYLQAQQAWEQANTPEAQAERYRQEAERARQEAESVRMAQVGRQFFEGELAPTVDALTNALPSVSADELAAKLVLLVEPYRVNGMVPPNRYQAVREAVVRELVPWAKYLHDARTAEREAAAQPVKAEAAKAKAEAEAARIKAQQAKRLVGKATKPVGRAAPDVPAKKPLGETVDDRMEDAVQSALAGVFARA